MIWADKLEDFKLCRRVYGRVMGVGVRKQRPALKDISSLNNPSGLSDDDVINCVDIEPRVCLGLIDVPDDVPSSIYEEKKKHTTTASSSRTILLPSCVRLVSLQHPLK